MSEQTPKPPNSVALVTALNHWTRRGILRWVSDDETKYCASDLEPLMGMPLSNVSYHMRTMAKVGLVRLVETERVRGATAYFYVSAVADNQIVRLVLQETEDEDVELEIAERRKRRYRQRRRKRKASK